jgi:hypothetical protein
MAWSSAQDDHLLSDTCAITREIVVPRLMKNIGVLIMQQKSAQNKDLNLELNLGQLME